MLKFLAIVLLSLLLAFVGYGYYVSQPVFDSERGPFEPRIADRTEALTFARSEQGLILVAAHTGDALLGFNLTRRFGEAATTDLLAFLSALDESQLPASSEASERFALADLLMPLSYTYPSVAAGTNFKEHAEEVYSDDPPFLFPKLVHAGAWNDAVTFLPRLDFEAELCMFPLSPISDPLALPDFGLVLCNDFTDRLTLIQELELGEPFGLTGFASGKACARCLPTGYLVVVPRSRDFYRSLEVALYVNDEKRQQYQMQDMILSIEQIVAQAFDARPASYRKGEETVRLLPHGDIPAGTLILTGTAAGVLFKPVNIWNQAFYLQPGDVVRTEATYLGHLENAVLVR